MVAKMPRKSKFSAPVPGVVVAHADVDYEESRSSLRFTGVLYLDGKQAAYVAGDGDGKAPRFMLASGIDPARLQEAQKRMRAKYPNGQDEIWLEREVEIVSLMTQFKIDIALPGVAYVGDRTTHNGAVRVLRISAGKKPPKGYTKISGLDEKELRKVAEQYIDANF